MSDDGPDEAVRWVELREDEYGGPFWDMFNSLGDDYDELHRWLGLSRELYDDVMAWHRGFDGGPRDGQTPAQFATQQDLLRRLREELPPEIGVPAPRLRQPIEIGLRSLTRDPDGVRRLPPLPDELRRRLIDWIADAENSYYANPAVDEAIFAWEDEGSAIAREMQAVLGSDYEVSSSR